MAEEEKEEQKPEPYVYTDFYEVPAAWRTLRGARLSLPQINRIVADAYARGDWTRDAEGRAVSFVPHWGAAREAHIECHEIVDNLWVERPAGGEVTT